MLACAARLSRTLETFRLDVLGRAPSTSLLLSGAADVILVNAQFLRDDAAQLAHTIAASGKRLTTIYISAAEPQAYFGLGVLRQAFPQARILASGATVEAIRRQAGARVAHWGGILKHNAPRCIVLPHIHDGASLQLEGGSVCLQSLLAALD
ncbi:hypothetical protein IGS61_25595 [Janthinobacterium sp. FW305-129]|uniref:hypothetical protein n=1 Tax=Janthinobacterium sp. FW305-129 TaxID=2775054 RepID=UPI001E4F1389|nr:hypothetical protein [Janthinobacterium sp. FW305-129]MCC7600888.1 hypothetical protein [Janthinobacterium sp. FW305-129]